MKPHRDNRPKWAQTFAQLAAQSQTPMMGHTMAKLLRAQAMHLQRAREQERRARE